MHIPSETSASTVVKGFAQAGDLIGKECEEIIPWLKDKNLLKAAVGLSVINAVLNNQFHESETGNVVKAIEMCKDETFGMVGDFEPILLFVRKQTEKIYVFERIAQEKTVYILIKTYHAIFLNVTL